MKALTNFSTILAVVLLLLSIYLIRERKTLKSEISSLKSQNESLVYSFAELAKKNTINLSIHPTINSKVTSAFGASKNNTLQYYFTIDGNSVVAVADSVYRISTDRKERMEKLREATDRAADEAWQKLAEEKKIKVY